MKKYYKILFKFFSPLLIIRYIHFFLNKKKKKLKTSNIIH